MAILNIRLYGDPVLATPAREVTDIDGSIVELSRHMMETLKTSGRGIGLAANQVGVLLKIFVYDVPSLGKSGTVINPVIAEREGEWTYTEGCLSVPGSSFEIVRPNRVLLKGLDLDGNEIEMEADELLGRLFQHEVDHLEGKLLLHVAPREALRKELPSLVSLVRFSGTALPFSIRF